MFELLFFQVWYAAHYAERLQVELLLKPDIPGIVSVCLIDLSNQSTVVNYFSNSRYSANRQSYVSAVKAATFIRCLLLRLQFAS